MSTDQAEEHEAGGAAGGLDNELAVACALAREGGALVRRYHQAWHRQGQDSDVPVQWKPGDEPVTEADRAVNTLCEERLRAAFPKDGLLTEETPDNGAWRRLLRTWLVDPIDGTKDFIAGRPGFAVMIGLLASGQPVLGVVYLPLLDEIYYATRGGGAFWVRGDGPPRRLRVSSVAVLEEARMVSSASHPSKLVQEVRAAAGIRDEMHIGSVGIKLSLIAAGERDLYINPAGRTKLWDTCGPEIILREAGGRLTDTRGEDLSYAGPELAHRRGLVASNGTLHDAAVGRVRTLLAGLGEAAHSGAD